MFRSWMKLARSASLLGLESHQVIAMRLGKLAKGGRAAQTEAHRMVAEKITAAQAAALNLAMGGGAGSVVYKYRKKVRANRTRLRRR
jgi:cell division GTPase FtsZ